MINNIKLIFKEQFHNKELIFRMATFEIKSSYQLHYLGILWQLIHPAIQVAIYWVVFGIGIRGGQPIDGIPFILWLLMGLIPWLFISPTLIQGSNSIHQKLSLVSKMNFPVSVLPTIKLIGNSFQFIILMIILFLLLALYGIKPSIYIVQLPYYLLALFVFLFSFSLFSSTVATLVRDYQTFLQSTIRMLLYISPILWDPSGDMVPDALSNILKLNPFYYIIEGVRSSFLGGEWFFNNPIYAIYFWSLTFILLYFGSYLHIKVRKNFMDYL